MWRLVQDLSRLNRDLARTVIVDNSPESYLLQPENAVPIKPFFGDQQDLALRELIPFLAQIASDNTPDVRKVSQLPRPCCLALALFSSNHPQGTVWRVERWRRRAR